MFIYTGHAACKTCDCFQGSERKFTVYGRIIHRRSDPLIRRAFAPYALAITSIGLIEKENPLAVFMGLNFSFVFVHL